MPAQAPQQHLAAALAYFDLGLCPVLLHARHGDQCSCGDPQCAAPGKHPRLVDWAATAAAATRQQVAEWWTKHPDANVGMLCGDWSRIAGPPGRTRVWVVAIDVDTKPLDASGRTGVDVWSDALDEHGRLEETWEARTPSGGGHYVFRHPGRRVPTRTHVLPGVDVRGDSNGQIVVSPSPGYAWDLTPARVELGSCPPWLAQLICQDRAPADAAACAPPDDPSWPEMTARVERARRYLGRCPVAVSGQRGHDTAWSVARSVVRGFALDEDHAMLALEEWNRACKPPWTDRELRHKVRSASRDARGIPWGAKLLRTERGKSEEGEGADCPEAAAAAVLDGAEPDWMARLIRTGKDRALNCEANAVAIFTHDERWQDVLAWDEFERSIVTMVRPPWDDDTAPADATRRRWSDSDTTRAQVWLQREWRMRLGPEATYAAAQVVADRRVVHPVRDYLESLRWDGELRLDTWLSTYLGAEDTAYSREVGRMMLIAAVARIYQPGCKVDTMPILEGAQGIGKSTALKTLFGADWFSDTPLDLDSKDRFVALRGKWCIEMAELDSLRRAEATRVKAFLSSPHDDYRPPFGRADVRAPRQCVFAGSTNAQTYLRDETGARRFWPVRCGRIDIEKIARDRDQLWAEAREHLQGGGLWWPEGELVRLCAEETDDRQEQDTWAEKIVPWLERRMPGYQVTVGEVLTDAIGLDVAKQGRPEQMRVGAVLGAAGWSRVRVRVGGGRKEYRYARQGGPTGPTSGPTFETGEPG